MTDKDTIQARAMFQVHNAHRETLLNLLTVAGKEIAESELVELARYPSAHLSLDYGNAHILLQHSEAVYVIFLNRLCERDAMLSVDIVHRYEPEELQTAIDHYQSAVFCTDLEGRLS